MWTEEGKDNDVNENGEVVQMVKENENGTQVIRLSV